jgi:hypothetical protein
MSLTGQVKTGLVHVRNWLCVVCCDGFGIVHFSTGIECFGCLAVRTSNSLPDAAIGRITHGTRLLRGGGFEGVYKQTFGGFALNELLKKTYACHLSTSNGAVSGTLYITNYKFAFCSDRELTYYPTPGQQASSYYKVCLI